MDRRAFLRSVAAAAASTIAPTGGAQARTRPEGVIGADKDYDFMMARVRFATDSRDSNPWNFYPGADNNLLEELAKVVRCRVKLCATCNSREPWTGTDEQFNAVVDLHDIEGMRRYPFLFMTSDGAFRLDQQQRDNLGRYLHEGGFLLMDDCVSDHGTQDYFYRAGCLELEQVFNRSEVQVIPKTHEVFSNVYDLSAFGLPDLQGTYHPAQGIFIDGRLAVFLSSTDLHCGWVDRNRTRFGYGGKRGRHCYDEAIQMGINLIVYSLSH